ncbi:MAG: hypothetical protein LBB49_06540 [Gracilibacteraceae bacterium]|jgi:hypothetical protein|nr:hypothetical protein [Gracilibacteraceae bacterium]
MDDKRVQAIVQILLGAGAGGMVGLFFLRQVIDFPLDGVVAIASLIFGFVFHIIIHEAGHLIMGKISGYRLVSFRVFSLTFVREKEKWVRKKYSIPGTLGQCLMAPPKMIDGQFPYVLYNLGGFLMNIIFSVLFFALYWMLFPVLTLSGAMFLPCAGIGVYLAVFNLIPMRTKGLPNDGHNIMTLGKNERARRAFWLVLHINALLSEGRRFRDIPVEEFDFLDQEVQRDESKSKGRDTLVLNAALYRFSRLIDLHEFHEGKVMAERLLENADKMPDIFKNEIRCELLFIEMMGECRSEEIPRLYTKELRKYMKATSSYVARQRLLYGYNKLVLGDDETASAALKMFNKTCLSYPIPGEVAGERELIRLIDDKAIILQNEE